MDRRSLLRRSLGLAAFLIAPLGRVMAKPKPKLRSYPIVTPIGPRAPWARDAMVLGRSVSPPAFAIFSDPLDPSRHVWSICLDLESSILDHEDPFYADMLARAHPERSPHAQPCQHVRGM